MNAQSLATLVDAAAADYAEEARLAAVAAAATLTTAQAELALDPSNVDKQKAVTAAAAASGAAIITQAQAQTTAAQTASSTAAADAAQLATAASTAAGVPALPVRKTVDFTPLMALNGALSTTYPFNLPSTISNYFEVFKGTPVAPVFEVPLGLGQSMSVDLSIFNGLATMIRYMIGLLVSVGIVFYLIHFYRGIS